MVVPIYIPTNSVGGLPLLHNLSGTYCCRFFNDDHSDWCEVIPHCSFDLQCIKPALLCFFFLIVSYGSGTVVKKKRKKKKNLPANAGDIDIRVQSLGQADTLEEEMTTHSSILATKIPWMEEPGKLHSRALQRLKHD